MEQPSPAWSKKNSKVIAFIGITGSGKTTQAKILGKRLGCPVISTGTVLRTRLEGDLAKEVAQGKVINDKVTIPLLEKELKKAGADKKEMVLDGSPRSLDQAKWLISKFQSGEFMFTAFIHLRASEAVVRARLLARGRYDDTDQSIAKRFDEYHDKVEPVLNYLKSQGYQISEIDGEDSVEQDAEAIAEALGVQP